MAVPTTLFQERKGEENGKEERGEKKMGRLTGMGGPAGKVIERKAGED